MKKYTAVDKAFLALLAGVFVAMTLLGVAMWPRQDNHVLRIDAASALTEYAILYQKDNNADGILDPGDGFYYRDKDGKETYLGTLAPTDEEIEQMRHGDIPYRPAPTAPDAARGGGE